VSGDRVGAVLFCDSPDADSLGATQPAQSCNHAAGLLAVARQILAKTQEYIFAPVMSNGWASLGQQITPIRRGLAEYADGRKCGTIERPIGAGLRCYSRYSECPRR
jgi:hypothetical protein